MHRTLRTLLALAALLPAPAFADVQQQWEHLVFAGTAVENDYGGAVVDASGRFFVATSAQLSSGGTSVALLTAFDRDGNVLWSRSLLQGGLSTRASDLALDPTTNDLVLVGASWAPGGGSEQPVVARYGVDGTLQWSRVVTPAQGTAAATDVVIDDTGRIFVLGLSVVSSVDMQLFACAPDGTLLWSRDDALTATSNDSSQGLALHPQGGVVVAGSSIVSPSLRFVSIARVDADGNRLWSKTEIGIPGYADPIACDAQGGVHVCGSIGRSAKMWNYTADGVATTSPVYDPGVFNGLQEVANFQSIAIDSAGDVVAVGTGTVEDRGNRGLVIVYDPSGTPIAQNALVESPQGGQHALSIVTLAANGRILVGGARLGNPNDAFAAALDPTCATSWTYVRPSGDTRDAGVPFLRDDGAGIALVVGRTSPFVSDDVLCARLIDQSSVFCAGDDTGALCPCGNPSAVGAGAGCLASNGIGATLREHGVASVTSDSLVLTGDGLPATSSVLFVQGTDARNGGLGEVFGDGLLCLDGTLVRLGTVPASGGVAMLGNGAPYFVSVRGQVAVPGALHYQAVYRNSAAYCTPDTLNTSNGLRVVWGP